MNKPKKVELAKKKIESPLAKYSGGNLFCVLCNCQVKSEMYWTGHVNGKGHRDNLLALKRKNNPESSKSSSAGGGGGPESKKAKIDDKDIFLVPKVPFPVKKSAPKVHLSKADKNKLIFEDAEREMNNQKFDIRNANDSNEDESMDLEDENGDTEEANGSNEEDDKSLPEGFFDNPKEDAKARGIEWKDPKEVEWEKFVKEIASEEIKSSELQVEDEEKSTLERELDEIEEQMSHWQRVIELEKRATQKPKKKKEIVIEEDDEEIEEEFDWRSKRTVTKNL